MHKLVILILVLLLSGAACGPPLNDRHLMGNGGGMTPGGGAGGDARSRLRFEKMSDAALGTEAAIANAANNRGTIKNAAQLGFRVAHAAATPSVSHDTQMGLEGGRHLMGNGGGMTPGGGGGDARSRLRYEKMSDAALGTQSAIANAANNRGTIKNAAQLGFRVAHAAATPSVSHGTQMGLEGGRRLTANTGYRDDVGSMDTAMAASSAIAKAVKAPSMGSASYATAAGTAAGRVASGAHPHTGFQTDEVVGGRRLASGYRDDVGAMDANLAASAAIAKAVKTPNMGGAKFATDAGLATGQVASGARSHTSWDTDMATGGRRLASNRDRSGVGTLDTQLAASEAISKAVKTPSMGSAKYATEVGSRTGRVGATAHGGWETDMASGGRRLRQILRL